MVSFRVILAVLICIFCHLLQRPVLSEIFIFRFLSVRGFDGSLVILTGSTTIADEPRGLTFRRIRYDTFLGDEFVLDRLMSGVFVFATVLSLVSVGCVSVATSSLIDEMTNLDRLAELPSPAYVTKQFSSYDRESVTPDNHEKWFANRDCGQFVRSETNGGREELVMMDIDGPGAIVRIWSANPKGTLRIYLDNNAEPVIEENMADLLGGKVAAFPEPIAGVRARGYNLYFPIPYASHCKVTSDEGGFYYHVNYRTYEPGTRVETFTCEELSCLKDKIQRVAGVLASPRTAVHNQTTSEHPFDLAIAPGESATVAELTGALAITSLELNLQANDRPAAARGLVLSISFDGEQTVETPLGDFFGGAPWLHAYASLPVGIVDGDPPTLYSHWLMPFGKSARITLRNLGTQKVALKGIITSKPYAWSGRSLLFHAKWRIERDIPTRPFTDWTHLACAGKGRFVGGALHIINPVREWWGEGDEKIYVDGEIFPSHFGTGTEDYYGYAWCNNEPFQHAYHNQPICEGPRNFGHTCNSRFHVLDDIPFTRQFRFDLENWHSHGSAKTDRAAISFWYARPGGTDDFEKIIASDVTAPERLELKVYKVVGAIEGEELTELTVPGNCRIENLGPDFSGEQHLWWERGKVGDKLVLGFEAGGSRQHVIARLTKNNDYAKVQLYINDQKAGDVIDLYANSVTPMDEIDLGEFDLRQGQNRLTVEIVGINEKAQKNYEFAVDYIKLK